MYMTLSDEGDLEEGELGFWEEMAGCGRGDRGSVHHDHAVYRYNKKFHTLITVCQERWGAIGGRLMSARRICGPNC